MLLNMKPQNEDILAQEPGSNMSEVVTEEESESLWEESELTETEVEATEEIEETEVPETQQEEAVTPEPPKETVSTPPAPPVDIPYYIRVNRQANCVTVYTKDAEGNYSVPVKSMICSVGLTGETPLGVYSIYARYQWRPLFGGSYGQYTLRFKGHFLFHSVPYSQQSKDSLLDGAFNKLGEPASQGCVRLMAIDAKWLYDNCINGTKVEIYDSPDPGPLGKPAGYKISENSPYKGWDPTDPDPANPWKKGVVSITGVKDVVVNEGETVDLLAGVSATDVDGLPLEVEVSDTLDWSVPGVHKVTYTATGVLGMTATVDATVTINAVLPPESEVPVEPETPTESETPTEPETPAEPEVSTESETPAESDVPTESEAPAESDVPAESETSVESEVPTEPEAQAESGDADDVEMVETTDGSETEENVEGELIN